MNTEPRTRSLSPTKAGTVYGHFTPSPIAVVMVKKSDGKLCPINLTRKERRRMKRG